MPAVTNEELARLRDLGTARALEQRLEASNAQSIADRDERVVAGEDTERAATTAANLAKQQLSGATGRGTAALVGMAKAEEARNASFANLLQEARRRKDYFEQKAVDRRNKALDIAGGASVAEQTRLRDNYLADQIAKLQAERDLLQREARANAMSVGGELTRDETARGTADNSPHINAEEWPTVRPGDDADKEATIEYQVEELKNFLKSKRTQLPTKYTVNHVDFTMDDPVPYCKNYDLFYNPLPRSEQVRFLRPEILTDALVSTTKVPKNKPLKTDSDVRVKKLYKGAGHNAGHTGNAKKSAKKAKARAEDWLDVDGSGVNEALVERFWRG